MSAVLLACGAVSAQGMGARAFAPGLLGEPSISCIRRDPELASSGLSKPFAARVALAESGDPLGLLELAARELEAELERELPEWRALRVGLALGTSGGGMPSLTRAVARIDSGDRPERELALAAPYFGPAQALAERLGIQPELRAQLLAACASSTFAIGQALTWLDLGVADLVIAGGYDALSAFIAAGFECLGATSSAPAPFRASRDGLALGEGAALLALGRNAHTPRPRVLGFGASSDAEHVTAPDREGKGLARAARLALAEAGLDPSAIRLVSAHGTGTSYNDAAEARALDSVLGAHAPEVVVHGMKGSIGHTLGAAGALESLGAMSALAARIAPATAGRGPHDAALTARLLDRSEVLDASACLKLSSAFGGANAALVLAAPGAEPPSARAPRPVSLLGIGEPATRSDARTLSGRVRTDAMKLARMDGLSLLVVTATSNARERAELGEDTGVIVGTAAATLEIDAEFERRRLARGPEPRRFPATSPNLCAGECTIAFGLRGPSFSVGGGPAAALEALLVAHDWVSAGRVDRVVVVAAEQVGPVVGVLWQSAGWPLPEHGAVAAILTAGEGPVLSRPHLALALAEAHAEGGSFRGEAPGFPAFRRALAEALD